MLDNSDRLIIFGGSLSGFIAASLYALYKSKYETAAEIKNAESVQLGAELESRLRSLNPQCIPYASVEGVVYDLGKTFTSKHSPKEGVILQTSRVEHKSQRIHGFWTDAKNILRDTFDVAPFAIRDPNNPAHCMVVTEAAEAEELMESLEVTHDRFIPHKSTPVQTGIDRLFGEVRHGVQETEEMLVVGTGLVGIGEIILEDGRLKLRPPQSAHYFLTRMSRGQLVKRIQSQASSFKVTATVFGLAALGLVTLLLWRLGWKYLAYRKTQLELEAIRKSALQRHAQARSRSRSTTDQDKGGECSGCGGGSSGVGGEDWCVVCLGNPREVVTLDCGHITMCCDCAERLPAPHKCPVCREEVVRFLPLYRP